ncbi:MBL fold metallo-hydrolase [Pseudoalteromonas sp. Cnat2-41]|uniref:MBL fold metallo-hydrolase n=1 Tax=unclassified Pseudoalteromonas TaxID=194690 RepID=UPI001EF79E6D|nr:MULTISPECIES: MBL fold metallo-hydrolase [unclassified Pseudoalteromonas]MCF2860622.1 MBL fold metallo-hydrolase [Pseudoalteromonas sp. CNAT2-18]MCG7556491.1 MBL fold metallo-hydrolase [Pseudoalteromonas sp. CNAT2-18.1]
MQVQVLGSSSGTPTSTRNVSGYAVFREDKKPWYLVDCGEATQHQILKTTLSLYHLEAIFITHKHGDHCYGLPGLLASAGLSGRQAPLTIIAPQQVLDFVSATLKLSDWQLNFSLQLYDYDALDEYSGSWASVRSCALQHRVPSKAYRFDEYAIPLKLDIAQLKRHHIDSGRHYNQLQRGENVTFEGRTLTATQYTYPSWPARSVMVCGDNEKPQCLDPLIEGVQLLVHEATFTAKDLHKVGFHTGHSDVERICDYAQQRQVPSLILTHFSARYGGDAVMAHIADIATDRYSGALYLAEDGLCVGLDKQGHSALIHARFAQPFRPND